MMLQEQIEGAPWHGPAAEMLAQWGFTPQATFEAFPLVFQVCAGLFAALVAWLLIHSGQRRASEESRRIERAKILHELDQEYAGLMARRCVVKSERKPAAKVAPEDMWLFEMVLTGAVPWLVRVDQRPEPNEPRDYCYINGARHVRVAQGYYVDTLTLHAMIAWSKRVASGLEARIVDARDVADMWRNVLPWAKANRFSFMADFFGVSDLRAPVEGRNGGLRSWRRRGLEPSRGVMQGISKALVRAGVTVGDRGRSVRASVPEQWSGDVAPLYRLIRAGVCRAVRDERMEMLNYLGLDRGPDDPKIELDPLIRAVMLHPAGRDATAPP